MKRKALLILLALFVVVAIARMLIPAGTEHGPRFVPGTPASLPPFSWDHYEFLSDVPFQNDQLWMWTAMGRTSHSYLYDLKRREVAGELFHGSVPELRSRDGSRILIRGSESAEAGWQVLLNAVRKMLGMSPLPADNRIEMFWILDLRDGSAVKVGGISQARGAGSTWHPSPDFRYGYTMPSTAFGDTIFLCDFEKRSMKKIPVHGNTTGWWNEREIMIATPKHEFELLNVETRKTRMLFSAAMIETTLAREGITNAPNPVELYPTSSWTGSNYTFYFGPKDVVNGLHGNGFLLKANRMGPQLELVSRDFGYRWGGAFDPSGTHYLFQGESGAPGNGGNGAVYWRNLADGNETTVVPPDNAGQYAIPKLYGNEILYFRNRQLHRMALDGGNDSLVLTNQPPANISP